MRLYLLVSYLVICALPLRAQVSSSVLSTGNWYKIGVVSNGIYKVSYEFLQSNGVVSAPVVSSSVKLFGKGGGMLPEQVAKFRHPDVPENAIEMYDGGDGNFGPGDYFLFYGQGPSVWTMNGLNQLTRSNNIYSDTTYYYVTIQGTNGKRIQSVASEPGTPVYSTNSFTDYLIHEKDEVSLWQSGREWFFRDNFQYTNSQTFPTTLEGWIPGTEVKFIVRIADRCEGCSNSYTLKYNNVTVGSFTGSSVPVSYNGDYASPTNFTSTNFIPTSGSGTIQLQKLNGQQGWLDYIMINYRRYLTVQSKSLFFRDVEAATKGLVSYSIANANNATRVWCLNNAIEPKSVQGNVNNGTLQFHAIDSTLSEFVVLGNIFDQPVFVGKVANQDLKAQALSQPYADYLIVTNKTLRPAAESLAEFHLYNDGMITHIIDLEEIYNEFSSGMQDITAIRDFVKFYYDHVPNGAYPKYLLLFGDGSYDYKTHLNRLNVTNTNLVPTYQSLNSFNRGGGSYSSDDYFGMMKFDSQTGSINYNFSEIYPLQIGVGRIVANKLSEANAVVDKIKHYISNSDCKREWRNEILLFADDMDESWEDTFVKDNEQRSIQMEQHYPFWNVDKLYADAYVQTNSAGQRYFDAEKALTEKFNKGIFYMHYSGHGGEKGLTSERILQIPQIQSWKNADFLPFLSTTTCTFTRFDNPEFLSAGEIAQLLPNTGVIAMLSTTRAITTAASFDKLLFDNLFTRDSSFQFLRLGDIVRLSKRSNVVGGIGNKMLLFGDPAMRLAYPKYTVVLTEINGNAIDTANLDTLKASQTVTLKGEVQEWDGTLLSDFNGNVVTTIFDKPIMLYTRQNDAASEKLPFTLQRNIVFKGLTSVSNGKFSITFQMPLDINYAIDKGKLSFYAYNDNVDAHGYSRDFRIGGSENNCVGYTTPPTVEIFMNDTFFVNNGITDANPDLLLRLFDLSGINTVGTGIGHDISMVIDGDVTNRTILNSYFQADLNSSVSGTVRYPLQNLSQGVHVVEVQVWNNCNIVTIAQLVFIVTDNTFQIRKLGSYPNPFHTTTNIVFEHNRADDIVDAEVTILDISGRIVKKFSKIQTMPGYREVSITWDGTENNGGKVASGVYLCRIRLKDSQGQVAQATCKLVWIG